MLSRLHVPKYKDIKPGFKTSFSWDNFKFLVTVASFVVHKCKLYIALTVKWWNTDSIFPHQQLNDLGKYGQIITWSFSKQKCFLYIVSIKAIVFITYPIKNAYHTALHVWNFNYYISEYRNYLHKKIKIWLGRRVHECLAICVEFLNLIV